MIQSVFDSKRDGLYRDRVKDFFMDRLIRTESMAESHYHPYFEIFYLLKGSCRIFADHSLFFVSEGEMVILPPATLHRTQYESQVERITISFTREYCQLFDTVLGKDFFDRNFKMCRLELDSSTRKVLDSLLEEIETEKQKNDQFSESNVKVLFARVIVLLARKLKQTDGGKAGIGESEASIEKAARFIFENYGKDITLQEAAKVAGMRDTYFSRKFQEVTGYGFKEYLTSLRIQHSQQMLLNSSLTITQIAGACGFASSNYFGDAFKKLTGLSPREFRRGRKNFS